MNRIKELRNEKSVSLQTVADQTKIPKSTLSNYEHGRAEPKRDNAIKLAQYFEVSPAYIMGISHEKNIGEIVTEAISEATGGGFTSGIENIPRGLGFSRAYDLLGENMVINSEHNFSELKENGELHFTKNFEKISNIAIDLLLSDGENELADLLIYSTFLNSENKKQLIDYANFLLNKQIKK